MIFKIIFFLSLVTYCLSEDRPVVRTNLGTVRGTHKKSYNGRIYSAFEGIPYAKSPVGAFRFEKPHDIEPWDGVWNATAFHVCMQLPSPYKVVEGDEDCLYLNIYVPREIPNADDSLDVFVHIHGGAFMKGSPQSYIKPIFVMDREIVFVTFTYRVGVLGFLSTEDNVVPGNNGLKDQTAALRWIKNNIQNFGGNPNSVTLTGFSSGAASVHYHYMSTLSRGLFHRGIAQSGVILNPRALQKSALKKTKKLASSLGCNQPDSRDYIDCLKQRPAKAIVNSTKLFYEYLFFPIGIFGPVVEVQNEDAFITKHPYKLLEDGGIINDVPLITSLTTEEGIFPVAYMEKHMINEIATNWESVFNFLFEYSDTVNSSELLKVARKIKSFYFGEENISFANIKKLIKVFTDRHYAFGAETAVRMQVKLRKSPIYFYIFGYKRGHNFVNVKNYYGVGHGEENIYLYNALNLSNLTDQYEQMKEVFLNMYTTFAKKNKPEIPGVKWDPVSDDITYLSINGPDQMSLQKAEEVSPIEFWNSLPIQENKNLFSAKDEL